MTLGPGRYDAEATEAREATDAQALVLIVLAGRNGNGFSVQTRAPFLLAKLPGILRLMAEQIEADIASEGH